ncbi:hypothetical protein ASPWEDRAFT_41601 [Aspergillus wentii DTO 134E9]|uniref:Fungal N-terminal domain-containing protein n=1 Tax=Aspergillus wentii DTO 134E9 TaxID=1073089 RepID=A0A1L9RFS6_ASPWE|nr:uncharacterized protein ASPWEDRAFT_41601 [Aspergillus wentii DTO 134E9]KAI9925500.1 hypothetical protein MW887_005881 [Aspergillus wentii]OJJ33737.1 hypothetical protein ASPWEDRAFT_41601 [Aspergillus wentii DTO 134E9]
MSGLEAIGIAASIIQVAELGSKLAVKLCTFYHQIKQSNVTIQSLSTDVSLTCSILQQLGHNLHQDADTKLYSANAVATAQQVLDECKNVFDKIDHTVQDQKDGKSKNPVVRATRKFGLALMERELDMLRGNLERLKSTVLLMLNVIIYAGQIRRKSEPLALKEQKDLVQLLAQEKKANDEKYTQLAETIQCLKGKDDPQSMATITLAASSTSIPRTSSKSPLLSQDLFPTEIIEYYSLIKGLLERVDSSKSTLEKSRHQRIRDGVVNVHLDEAGTFQSIDRQKLSQLFGGDSLFKIELQASLCANAENENNGRITVPGSVHYSTYSDDSDAEASVGLELLKMAEEEDRLQDQRLRERDRGRQYVHAEKSPHTQGNPLSRSPHQSPVVEDDEPRLFAMDDFGVPRGRPESQPRRGSTRRGGFHQWPDDSQPDQIDLHDGKEIKSPFTPAIPSRLNSNNSDSDASSIHKDWNGEPNNALDILPEPNYRSRSWSRPRSEIFADNFADNSDDESTSFCNLRNRRHSQPGNSDELDTIDELVLQWTTLSRAELII